MCFDAVEVTNGKLQFVRLEVKLPQDDVQQLVCSGSYLLALVAARSAVEG